MQLTAALKQATWALHRQAERQPFMHALLSGKLPTPLYTEYLKQLLPVYQAIKTCAEKLNCANMLLLADIDRVPPLQHDLQQLGAEPTHTLSNHYAESICQIQQVDLLIAHYYVRYLGDLHGGQIIAKILHQKYQLPKSTLHFYTFPGNTQTWIANVRSAINTHTPNLKQTDIMDEAKLAFQQNIDLMKSIYTKNAP